MALRILTFLLLLAVSGRASAQPTPRDIELRDRGRQEAIERGLPPRATPPPPIAPPAATQIDPADRRGVLIATAAYLRERADKHRTLAGADSVVLDTRYHVTAGTVGHLRDPNHSHVDVPAEELQLLQRELRAGMDTLEGVQTNCRPLRGCELTVSQFYMLGEPVLRADGTVTLAVEHRYRSVGGRQPTVTAGFELVLTRIGTAWSVTAHHSRLMT